MALTFPDGKQDDFKDPNSWIYALEKMVAALTDKDELDPIATKLQQTVNQCEEALAKQRTGVRELNSVIAEVKDQDWELILADSGSAVHACPEAYGRSYGLRESPRVNLATATGKGVKHYGTRTIPYEVEDGGLAIIRYEVLDVHKPIVSLGKLSKSQHRVALNPPGERSFIQKRGREIGLIRRNDVFWFKAKKLPPEALTRNEKRLLSQLDKHLEIQQRESIGALGHEFDTSYVILHPTAHIERPLRVPQITIRNGPFMVAPVGESSSSSSAGPDVVDVAPKSSEKEFGHHRAKGLRIPVTPSDAERCEHELTHVAIRGWCPQCVAGKSKDPSHRAQVRSEDGLPKAFLDY